MYKQMEFVILFVDSVTGSNAANHCTGKCDACGNSARIAKITSAVENSAISLIARL
jgi:hypothetical protein